MSDADQHPAAAAHLKSFAAAMSGDKETWLGLFADDAVIEDPVGVSALDPSGGGHRGREAIENFWNMTIAAGQVKLNSKIRIPRARECAVLADVENTIGDQKLTMQMIVVYRVNDAGKIVSLRAFWDYDRVAELVAKMMNNN